MSFNKDSFICDNARYERSKIGKLRNEREEIQMKTYKNWINSILIQGRSGINDIYTDFTSGEKLILLLQLLTGERVGKINQSSSLLAKIANVSQCLKFIKSKNVYLESIGPDDIVNGNKKLTLGLIWTLILRFQLSKHLEMGKYDLKTIKESLLLWCQNKTKHLQFVQIVDFHRSWQDGWAFVALVHSFRPESIDIEALRRKENRELMAIAFDTAYQQLMIPKILDIDDVINEPDENSILTYVSYFYNLHSRTKNCETNVKRIKYLLTNMCDIDNMKSDYTNRTAILLIWIDEKSTLFHQDVDVSRAHDEILEFNNYFFQERPEKLKQRNECQTLYFDIVNEQKKAGVKNKFKPKKGLTVKDLESAWLNLEKAETVRQTRLKDLINQHGKLRRKAQLFDLKNRKFENYINSKLELLNKIFHVDKDISKEDLEKHMRQSEAICHDIITNNVKFDSLIMLTNEFIEQKHDHQEFYHQYKIHMNEKLKKIQQLATSNLCTIEQTRKQFLDLYYVENVYNELEELYRQLSLIVIHRPGDSVQVIFSNLERMKYLEMHLDVLEKKYFESYEKFQSISENRQNKHCFLIIDFETYEKKLSESLANINACRDKIDKNKNVLKYQLDLNDFYANIECLNQFLNEKRIITNWNPDEYVNSSSIHFIQRRNNIVKLEVKIMEKELYSTCKKGYSLMNVATAADQLEVSQSISSTIDDIKKEFQSFIVVVNERTLLINECITLFSLINELNDHEELITDLNDNFYECLKEKIDFYQNDLLYLNEIFDKLSKLSINLAEYDYESPKSYIVYLKQYPLDHLNLSSSHLYLIIHIEHFPQINLEKFWTIHVNLFEFIKLKMNHVKRLLCLTEFDFDTNRLRQMLDIVNDVDEQEIVESQRNSLNSYQQQSSSMKDDQQTTEEIDLLFKLFFEKNQTQELEDLLKRRQTLVCSDFANMDELVLVIKHTMKLIDSVKNIVDLCQTSEKQENLEKEAVVVAQHEDLDQQQQHPIEETSSKNQGDITPQEEENKDDNGTIEIELSENIQTDKTIGEQTSEQQESPFEDFEDNSDDVYCYNQPAVRKRKMFTYKLKNDLTFINQYIVDMDPNDSKFKLNFLGKMIEDNVKRIEIYIIENPDEKSKEQIETLSNELNKCSDELVNYQKLSTFKEFLDDFNCSLNDNLDNLQCIKPSQNSFDENSVRNDLRAIDSIEILYLYYSEQLMNLKNHYDRSLSQYLNELSFIFDKYKKTIDSTKQLLKKRWSSIEEKKRQERLNSWLVQLNKQAITSLPQNSTIDNFTQQISDNDKFNMKEDSELQEIKIEKPTENLTSENPKDPIQDLLNDLELILFDVNCGVNPNNYKKEQMQIIYDEAISLTDDPETISKLNFYKTKLDQILLEQNRRQQMEDFQSLYDQYVQCCRQVMNLVDEIVKNVKLPMNPIDRQQVMEEFTMLKMKSVHYKSLFDSIKQDYSDCDQIEIQSKIVYLQDVLEEVKLKIDKLQSFIEVEEELSSISDNIRCIFQVLDDNNIRKENLQLISTQTDETQNHIERINHIPIVKKTSLPNVLYGLKILLSKASLMTRYKILNIEFEEKLKKFDTRQSANDERFQQFIIDIHQQKDLLDKAMMNVDLTRGDNQKILSNIISNYFKLMKKFDSFSYLLEVDQFRTNLASIEEEFRLQQEINEIEAQNRKMKAKKIDQNNNKEKIIFIKEISANDDHDKTSIVNQENPKTIFIEKSPAFINSMVDLEADKILNNHIEDEPVAQFDIDPQLPDKDIKDIINEISKVKYLTKVLVIHVGIINEKDGESIQEMEIEPQTSETIIYEIIVDVLRETSYQVKSQNDKVLLKIFKREPKIETMDEPLQEWNFDPTETNQNVDQFIKKSIMSKIFSEKIDPDEKIFLQFISKKPNGDETIREIQIIPEIYDDDIERLILEFIISPKGIFNKNDKHFIKLIKRRPVKKSSMINEPTIEMNETAPIMEFTANNGENRLQINEIDKTDSSDQIYKNESFVEFIIDSEQPEKNIDLIMKEASQNKDQTKRLVLQYAIAKPNGNVDSLEEIVIDPGTPETIIYEIILDILRDSSTKQKDPKDKIVFKVLKRRPKELSENSGQSMVSSPDLPIIKKDDIIEDDEIIGEFKINNKSPEKNIKDIVKKASKAKDPKKKLIIQLVRKIPDGETVEELEFDSEIKDKEIDENIRELIKNSVPMIKNSKDKVIIKIIRRLPKKSTVEQISEKSVMVNEMKTFENHSNPDEKELYNQNDKQQASVDENVENEKIEWQYDDDDQENTFKDDEICEFIIDPRAPEKNVQDILHKISDAKDPNKRMIILLVIKSPKGNSIEEMELEPNVPDDDVDESIRGLLNYSSFKANHPKAKIVFKIINRKLKQPFEDEIVEEFKIDHKLPEKHLNIIRKLIWINNEKPKQPDERVIIQFVIEMAEGQQTIQELELDPQISEKDVDFIIKKHLQNASQNPEDKIIFKMIKRKPCNNEVIEQVSKQEFNEKPEQNSGTEIIESFQITALPIENNRQIEKNDGKIMKEKTAETPINASKQVIPDFCDDNEKIPEDNSKSDQLPKANGIIPNQQKVIEKPETMLNGHIPRDDETISEFKINNKSPEKNVKDIVKKASKAKDPKKKLIIQLIRKMPDGETVEELEFDSEAKNKDVDENIRKMIRNSVPKIKNSKDKVIIKILRRMSKSSTKQITVAESVQENSSNKKVVENVPEFKEIDKIISQKPSETNEKNPQMENQRHGLDGEELLIGEYDFDSEKFNDIIQDISKKTSQTKDPTKILVIRLIHKRPDGDKIEDVELQSDVNDRDVTDIIREVPAKMKSPNDKMIIRIIRRKPKEPMEDELFDQFNIDSKMDPKQSEEIITRSIEKITPKLKNPDERIIIQFLILQSNGNESIEEMEIDPKLSKNDVDNHLVPDFFSGALSNVKHPKDKIIFKIFKRKPTKFICNEDEYEQTNFNVDKQIGTILKIEPAENKQPSVNLVLSDDWLDYLSTNTDSTQVLKETNDLEDNMQKSLTNELTNKHELSSTPKLDLSDDWLDYLTTNVDTKQVLEERNGQQQIDSREVPGESYDGQIIDSQEYNKQPIVEDLLNSQSPDNNVPSLSSKAKVFVANDHSELKNELKLPILNLSNDWLDYLNQNTEITFDQPDSNQQPNEKSEFPNGQPPEKEITVSDVPSKPSKSEFKLPTTPNLDLSDDWLDYLSPKIEETIDSKLIEDSVIQSDDLKNRLSPKEEISDTTFPGHSTNERKMPTTPNLDLSDDWLDYLSPKSDCTDLPENSNEKDLQDYNVRPKIDNSIIQSEKLFNCFEPKKEISVHSEPTDEFKLPTTQNLDLSDDWLDYLSPNIDKTKIPEKKDDQLSKGDIPCDIETKGEQKLPSISKLDLSDDWFNYLSSSIDYTKEESAEMNDRKTICQQVSNQQPIEKFIIQSEELQNDEIPVSHVPNNPTETDLKLQLTTNLDLSDDWLDYLSPKLPKKENNVQTINSDHRQKVDSTTPFNTNQSESNFKANDQEPEAVVDGKEIPSNEDKKDVSMKKSKKNKSKSKKKNKFTLQENSSEDPSEPKLNIINNNEQNQVVLDEISEPNEPIVPNITEFHKNIVDVVQTEHLPSEGKSLDDSNPNKLTFVSNIALPQKLDNQLDNLAVYLKNLGYSTEEKVPSEILSDEKNDDPNTKDISLPMRNSNDWFDHLSSSKQNSDETKPDFNSSIADLSPSKEDEIQDVTPIKDNKNQLQSNNHEQKPSNNLFVQSPTKSINQQKDQLEKSPRNSKKKKSKSNKGNKTNFNNDPVESKQNISLSPEIEIQHSPKDIGEITDDILLPRQVGSDQIYNRNKKHKNRGSSKRNEEKQRPNDNNQNPSDFNDPKRNDNFDQPERNKNIENRFGLMNEMDKYQVFSNIIDTSDWLDNRLDRLEEYLKSMGFSADQSPVFDDGQQTTSVQNIPIIEYQPKLDINSNPIDSDDKVSNNAGDWIEKLRSQIIPENISMPSLNNSEKIDSLTKTSDAVSPKVQDEDFILWTNDLKKSKKKRLDDYQIIENPVENIDEITDVNIKLNDDNSIPDNKIPNLKEIDFEDEPEIINEELIEDLEKRVDTIGERIEDITNQIQILNQHEQEILNRKTKKARISKETEDSVQNKTTKMKTLDKEEKSSTWLDYLSPDSKPKEDSTSIFEKIINWTEIERDSCAVDVTSKYQIYDQIDGTRNKSVEDKTIGEVYIDPQQPERNISEIINNISRASDPSKRLVIRLIITRPDGDLIKELELDPNVSDEDIDGNLKELLLSSHSKSKTKDSNTKIIFRIIERNKKSVEKPVDSSDSAQEISNVVKKNKPEKWIKEPEQWNNDDELIGELNFNYKEPEKDIKGIIKETSKAKDPIKNIVIQFINKTPDGDVIEEMEFEPEITDQEIEKNIKELLDHSPKDPKKTIIIKILKRKTKQPTEDEPIDQFDIDLRSPVEHVEHIVHRSITPAIATSKPNERIIIRLIVITSDGAESNREFEVDPEMSDMDIEKTIGELLKKSSNDPKNKIIFKILKRKFKSTKFGENILSEPTIEKLTKENEMQKVEEPNEENDMKAPEKNIKDIVKKLSKAKDKIFGKILKRKSKKKESPDDEVLDQHIDSNEEESTKLEDTKSILEPPIEKKSTKNENDKTKDLFKYDEPIDEFNINYKAPEKHVKDIVKKLSKSKDPKKMLIIRLIIKKPDGDEIEELEIESNLSNKDFDEHIRKMVCNATNRKTKDKIILKILKRNRPSEDITTVEKQAVKIEEKTTGYGQVTEIESTFQTPIEDFPNQQVFSEQYEELQNKNKEFENENKEQKSEIVSESSETIESKILKKDKPKNWKDESEELPKDDETIEEFNIDQKEPEKHVNDIVKKLSKVKDPMKILVIQFIFKTPNSDIIEEIEFEPETTVQEIDDNIRKLLHSSYSKDPKAKIIIKILKRKPKQLTEDQTIKQLNIDPQSSVEQVDHIVHRLITPAIATSKPNERIIIRLIVITPDGTESEKEFEVDPEMSDIDFEKTIGELMKKSSNDPKNKIVFKILKRKPKSKESFNKDLLEKALKPSQDSNHQQNKIKLEEKISSISEPNFESISDEPKKIETTNSSKKEYNQIVPTFEKDTNQDKPKDEDTIKEFVIDPKCPEEIAGCLMNKTIKPLISSEQDPNERIVICFLIQRPDEKNSTVEAFVVDPEMTENEIENAIKDILRKEPFKKPKGKIIFRILKPKLNKEASKENITFEMTNKEKPEESEVIKNLESSQKNEESMDKETKYNKDNKSENLIQYDEPVGEFNINHKAPEKNVKEIVKKASKARDPTKKLIISFIIKTPNEDAIEEIEVESENTDKEIDENIRKIIRRSYSKDPKAKIIIKILKRKQRTNESTDVIFPETEPQEIIPETIPTLSGQKSGPDEHTRDDHQVEKEDRDKPFSEIIEISKSKVHKKDKPEQWYKNDEPIGEFNLNYKEPEKDIKDIVKEISKAKDPTKNLVIQFINKTPEGDVIEEMEFEPEITDQEIEKNIKELLDHSPKDPKKTIIIKILKRKTKQPTEDEPIDQFDIDLRSPVEHVEHIVHRSITPAIATSKPNERIIIRLIVITPDGAESNREFEVDPEMSDMDIEKTIEELLKKSLNDPKNKIIFKILKRKPKESNQNVLGKSETIPSIFEKPSVKPTIKPNTLSKEENKQELSSTILLNSKKISDTKESQKDGHQIDKKIPDLKMSEFKKNELTQDDDAVAEFTISHKDPEKHVNDIVKKASKYKDPNKKLIIRFTIKTQNGDVIEELGFEPETTDKEIDDNIRKIIRRCYSKDPKAKIIVRTLNRVQKESTENDQIDQFDIVPQSLEKQVNHIVNKSIKPADNLTSKPNQRIIIRMIIIRSNDHESIEEFEIDPEMTDFNIKKMIKEHLQNVNPKNKIILQVRKQTLKIKDLEKINKTDKEIVPGSSSKNDIQHIEQQKPNNEETIYELMIDPLAFEDYIKDILAKRSVTRDLKNKLMIRYIIKRPNGDFIEEFEMDPNVTDKDFEEQCRRFHLKVSAKAKDPKSKIILRIIRHYLKEPKKQTKQTQRQEGCKFVQDKTPPTTEGQLTTSPVSRILQSGSPWLDYLTPQISPEKSDSDISDFINWTEIDNVTCLDQQKSPGQIKDLKHSNDKQNDKLSSKQHPNQRNDISGFPALPRDRQQIFNSHPGNETMKIFEPLSSENTQKQFQDKTDDLNSLVPKIPRKKAIIQVENDQIIPMAPAMLDPIEEVSESAINNRKIVEAKSIQLPSKLLREQNSSDRQIDLKDFNIEPHNRKARDNNNQPDGPVPMATEKIKSSKQEPTSELVLYDQESQDSILHGSPSPRRTINGQLRRVFCYSLPFYFLFIIILLIYLLLPKDEDEFNCLRRTGYDNNGFTIQKVYIDGPPPM